MAAVASAMTSLGNGWWLCTADFVLDPTGVPGSAQKFQPLVYLDNGSGTAANSISYTGDGSSGVNIWWMSVLPTAAWDIKNLSFFDDFNDLNSIDLTNTKTAGYKWYVNNSWPNSTFTLSNWTSCPVVCHASTFSISSPSVLKIYNPTNATTGFGSWLYTAVEAGGTNYISNGNIFQPPMVWDQYVNWDGTTANWNSNWGFLGPISGHQPLKF